MTAWIRAILVYAGVYLALTSNLELANIVVGLILGAATAVLVRPMLSSLSINRWPAAIWASLRYVATLAYDLVVSGLQTARLVISPSLPIRPGIIEIPPDIESEIGTALNAHAITLTPGELVVEMDKDGRMYTHCLDATRAAEYIAAAVSMRGELLDEIIP